MSGEITVKLRHPIEAHGQTIEELKLRRPKLKDLRDINLENLTGAVMIDLVAALADIPPSSAGEIDAEDFDAIGEVFEGFFPKTAGPGGSA